MSRRLLFPAIAVTAALAALLQTLASTVEVSDTNALTKVSWLSETNTTYLVQWSTNLSDGVWSNLCDELQGNGEIIWVYDDAHDATSKYYRVVANP